MTIADLLVHHGIARPRWVDIDGRIIFTEPMAGAPAPMPIKRHTFHGGDDPIEDAAVNPWWEDEAQLRRHREAMAQHFPAFVYLPAEDECGPTWVGDLDTGRGRFRVALMGRGDGGLPGVVLLDRKAGKNTRFGWKNAPHTYRSGALCVADQGDWDPERDTMATAVGWTAHWLAAYTEWKLFGKWPVEGFQPDVAA